MAPHSSTLAWKIPWAEEPRGVQSMESLRVGHDWATSLSRIGEGNGNPLQCSCLENPRDGGTWWAAVYGVTRVRHDWSDFAAAAAHASKVMLKILQARLQQYVHRKLPDVQVGFRKGRGTRDQIAKIHWITEKSRVPEKHLLLIYWLRQSLWPCGSQQTVENS